MNFNYFRRYYFYFLCSFALFLSTHYQCIAQTHMIVPPGPAPNTCKIIGKIIKIAPVPQVKTPQTPCEKQACQAEVKVVKILGCGAGFPQFQGLKPTITVKFVFTLGATQALFPQLNKAMPGLKVGDVFEASVEGMDAATGSNNQYKIYTYTKQ
ncbi:hypothetical protein [uncultured Microscilla sp.]|uniref:hypothetical protein n=1 Tax=uncultured Microscilla sp. TaxID=432653 RepID=UPI0026212A20|nr:hypothetical protein [uncultured Microscilla sp.]